MRILPCGDEGLLVEVTSLAEVETVYLGLRRDTPRGVTELVPAARTVLVAFDPATADAGRLAAAIRRVHDGDAGTAVIHRETAINGETEEEGTVEVPVRYDGADLPEVARLTGLSVAEVVERHARGDHRVAFCGFAPGFAYIAGLDPALRVPRRDSPRTRVPAGAVAIADEFSGVYPRSSPGGWRLIGHTDLPTFDLERVPPAVLAPGVRVRFVRVSG